ncbi:thioredoxin [Kockovaella imperatae]|uniref:Thioredoxin n=1 Tax=Kockovaella imperatae TaxID=4999 RepID=A0A1Y1U6J2_9TREE|nr:thioredoxin [Kockovaella imperatae]ORX33649.1 thioredoxin [Kockovaella imperatae]
MPLSKSFRIATNTVRFARSVHSSPVARDHFLNANREVFEKRALDANSSKPLLVDFTASWCGPCKILGPMLQRLTTPDTPYDLMTVDVDENNALAAEYKVSAVPFVVGFKNGKPVDKFIGMLPEAKVKAFLESL